MLDGATRTYSSSDHSNNNETLFNMMKLSDNCCPDFDFTSQFINDENIKNRNYAVEWMKQCVEQVLGCDCPSTRDTSVQIFDKFLLGCYADDADVLQNSTFLSYAASSSILLSAKLNDTNSKLTMNKFSSFDAEQLVSFEHLVLSKTGCRVSPLCTPSNFLHYILDCSSSQQCDAELLLSNADKIISEFLAESDSMLYAPSTIAVSALLISFSILKIPCEDWLNSIPLYLFVNEQNPFFESGYGHCAGKKSKFLDQDVCIVAMIKIPFLRALMAEKGQSPTSVGDNPSRFD